MIELQYADMNKESNKTCGLVQIIITHIMELQDFKLRLCSAMKRDVTWDHTIHLYLNEKDYKKTFEGAKSPTI